MYQRSFDFHQMSSRSATDAMTRQKNNRPVGVAFSKTIEFQNYRWRLVVQEHLQRNQQLFACIQEYNQLLFTIKYLT